MKKLFNKLSASGNLREEVNTEEDEHLDTHFRKPTTLPADAKDTSEDIKVKKSFSLSKATSPRFKDALEGEEFSKKKSTSTGLKKDKPKDKLNLNESDDKHVRKSKSAKAISPKKSSDQLKGSASMRSPSLKSIFASQYEQQKDGHIMDSSSDSDSEEDAFVLHQHPNPLDDDEFNLSFPIRVPSAPARLASSPSPSPSPSFVSLHVRTSSPSPSLNNGMRVTTPTTPPPLALPPSSPVPFSTSPTARVPAFTQSPPAHALAPKPHLVIADEFDAKFGPTAHDGAIFGTPDSFNGDRDRSESLDHFNLGKDTRLDSESVEYTTETDEVVYQKKSGLFSFGSNKSTKLKA